MLPTLPPTEGANESERSRLSPPRGSRWWRRTTSRLRGRRPPSASKGQRSAGGESPAPLIVLRGKSQHASCRRRISAETTAQARRRRHLCSRRADPTASCRAGRCVAIATRCRPPSAGPRLARQNPATPSMAPQLLRDRRPQQRPEEDMTNAPGERSERPHDCRDRRRHRSTRRRLLRLRDLARPLPRRRHRYLAGGPSRQHRPARRAVAGFWNPSGCPWR